MHHAEANRVRPYSEHTSDEWVSRLRKKLDADIGRIQSAQVIARAIVQSRAGEMSKLAEATAALKATHKEVDARSQELLDRIHGLNGKIPGAFAKAGTIIESHSKDVDQMENELNQLSNFPLDGSHSA